MRAPPPDPTKWQNAHLVVPMTLLEAVGKKDVEMKERGHGVSKCGNKLAGV